MEASGTTKTEDLLKIHSQAYFEAWKAGDVRKLESFYEDEAISMPHNGGTLYGKREIREWLEEFFRFFKVVDYAQAETEVTVAGDWAFERRAHVSVILPVEGGSPIRADVRYLRVWRLKPSGEWKISQQMWSRVPDGTEHPDMRDRFFLERDFTLAEETQRSLLPHTLPEFQNFRIRAFSKPTHYVGGDMYDFMERDGELIAVLADVSGKGVSAALLSSLLQGALHTEFGCSGDPAEVMNRLNKFLCAKTGSARFVALFLLAIDSRGTGCYISAGHNPAFLFRSATGQIEDLPSTGLILGAFDFASYQTSPIAIQKGDVLVVYSDGLTEAENPSGEMLGDERARAVVLREAPAGAERLEKALLEALHDFTQGRVQSDDITIMAIERVI